MVCAVLGLGMLICGFLVPAHLRAVDDTVLERAGKGTPDLVGQGLALAYEKNLGSAQFLWAAAQLKRIPHRDQLNGAITSLAERNPNLKTVGAVEPGAIGALFQTKSTGQSEVITDFLVRMENRERALKLLEESANPVVRELLSFRSVTNTVLFPPSQSASGQAVDTALSILGLLVEGNHLSARLNRASQLLAAQANRENTHPFEQMLMDLTSLGQRLNWGQMMTFVGQIEDPETLHLQANLIRTADSQLPILFSAVQLSANPAGVAKYLTTFDQTGFKDLGVSLRYGMGGVNELLLRNQRLHISRFEPLLADWSLRIPWLAITVKWIFYLLGGFLLAMAMHFARPAVTDLEKPLQVRGFHIAREFLFALGFLLVVLLASEPFLAQESHRAEPTVRLHLPTVGGATPAGTTGATPSIMNPTNKLIVLLFFVVQGLLYTACVVKLAEIRRQQVRSAVKVKLLENEEHLFDAGLYLGFLGTIISFVLYSLNHAQQFSLMTAYSSTSLGIIFVSFFKIVHLRPARRKLLLQAEAEQQMAATVEPASALAAPL